MGLFWFQKAHVNVVKWARAAHFDHVAGDTGRTKERVRGRRISRRQMFRAPKAWHPVLEVKDGRIVREYWERD